MRNIDAWFSIFPAELICLVPFGSESSFVVYLNLPQLACNIF